MTAKLSFEMLKYITLNQQEELESISINHPQFSANLFIQGAQLTSFKPKSQNDWLWLSPLEAFKTGQAVRGGIPICLPWFGVNRHDKSTIKHGFVRNNIWQLNAIKESDESVKLELSYAYTPSQQSQNPTLFPSAFKAKVAIILQGGPQANIEYAFELEHLSPNNQVYSYAFHSYFNVADAAATAVCGLEQHHYLDNSAGLSSKEQTGPIFFSKEVDRVYQATTQPQQLQSASQNLIIHAKNAPTCIIWNPHNKLAQSIKDIKQHVTEFICIERGCAFADEITLAQGQKHHSSMRIYKKTE